MARKMNELEVEKLLHWWIGTPAGYLGGFGGYPAFPTLAAAGKVPIVLHEQNAVLGRVNRIFAKKAKVIQPKCLHRSNP